MASEDKKLAPITADEVWEDLEVLLLEKFLGCKALHASSRRNKQLLLPPNDASNQGPTQVSSFLHQFPRNETSEAHGLSQWSVLVVLPRVQT